MKAGDMTNLIQTKRIVAVGELVVEVMRTAVDQPLSQTGEFVGPFPSGAPAIFIDAVARLGLHTRFIGVVGPDSFGDCIVDQLKLDGVDTATIRKAPGYTTGIAFVAYRSDGSRNFVFHLPQSAAALLGPEDVAETALADAAFVHITGSALSVSESSRQACYRAIELVKKAGGKVSFDPNLRPELLGGDALRAICQPVLSACDVLLPSGAEAALVSGIDDQDQACRWLVEQGIPIVALKLGSNGSRIFTAGGSFYAAPLEVNEVDPTGAGDCYGGGFVTGLLEGWELEKVARFANVVGALSVTRRGTMSAPRRDEVLAKL
jgi:sugar/nucleoside kinase (ribokinase family)